MQRRQKHEKTLSRSLSLCCILLLMGLLTGCSQQEPGQKDNNEATATTTQPTGTEPEYTGPMLAELERARTPEEFLYQLNLYMKENDIALEFSFGERVEEGQINWILCSPVKTGGETAIMTSNVELWVGYTPKLYYLNDDLKEIRVSIDPSASVGSHDYHRLLSIAVSVVCDDAVTKESAAKLYDAPWQGSNLVANEDGVAFIAGRDCASQYIQSEDLLHHYQKGTGELYKVVFQGQQGKTQSMTVQELEDCINAHFASKEIPIECAFALTGQIYDSEDSEYGDASFAARFRFTSWDDPNIQYAVPDLAEGTIGYCENREYYEKKLYDNFAFSISVDTKGTDYDAPIYHIVVESLRRLPLEQMPEPWDESWRAIYKDMLIAICDLWTQEVGGSVLRDAADEMFASGAIEINSQAYAISGTFSPDNWDRFGMLYRAGALWPMEKTDPILDPQRLDYKFTYTAPIVQNGLFFENDSYLDRHRFRTDVYGRSAFGYDIPTTLDEYLTFTGSEINLTELYNHLLKVIYYRFLTLEDRVAQENEMANGDYWYTPGESFREQLDGHSFGFEEIELEPFDYENQMHTYMYYLYYSETEPCPVDIDNLFAAAIGLSQIADEGMTVEEAFDLHLTEQEVALTLGDWQISYTAPREVSHIICKNPTTGMTRYYVIPQELFQTEFGTLEAFATSVRLG